jgi:hypothetical protein
LAEGTAERGRFVGMGLLRVQGRRWRAKMAGGHWLCFGRATTKDPGGRQLYFQKNQSAC